MGKSKVLAIGTGIASIVIGIFGFYLFYQASGERDYINEANMILSERNQIINEFMSDLLPRLEAKQTSIAEVKARVSSLSNDADGLHNHAIGMDVPDKYKSAHPYLIQGLDSFNSSVKSASNALHYIEDALQTGQQEQIPSTSIIGSIFGFYSLPHSSETSKLSSDAEAAKSSFNDAVMYLERSEERLGIFSSLAHLDNSSASPAAAIERAAGSPATQKQLEACKELGVPAFSCSQEKILAKKGDLEEQAEDREMGMHIHVNIKIIVGGKSVPVPANIGIAPELYKSHELDAYGMKKPKMSSLHTYDSSGLVHVESTQMRPFTLGEFFDVWGVAFSEECIIDYCGDKTNPVRMYVNGKEGNDFRQHVFLDGELIEIVLMKGTE